MQQRLTHTVEVVDLIPHHLQDAALISSTFDVTTTWHYRNV